MNKKKYFLLGVLIGIILIFSYILSLPDGKLHIVFCNVGQGDAAYLRFPGGQDMLIDGGPDRKVLDCLGRHMPFYDRTIDIVALSHPQKDHLQGLIDVVERYNVGYFIIGIEGNETEGYKRLVAAIERKKVPIRKLYRGDTFSAGDSHFSVLWPDRDWVATHLSPHLSDLSDLSDSRVLGLQAGTNLNSFSYFLHLVYGTFDVLFTGDGDSKIQPEIMKMNVLPDIEVLKFPHHGSRTGILSEFLDIVRPELAVISVGKNPYGHPTKEAIEQLNNRAIKLKRTDLDGDVEVISDGSAWSIK